MRIDTKYFPWLDRAGRVSSLKLFCFATIVLPGLWIALELVEGWLQPKPITEAIHQSGTWAIRFLLISLAVTPLRRIGQWGKLIAVRRMLGVAVLAYGTIHLSLYVVDQHFDLAHVASEIALRFYLTIGFAALIGFTILGMTSTDSMIRRLGSQRWQQLHRVVYGLGVLALLHFMLQAKLDITQPVLMTGLFLVAMGWRLLQTRKRGDSVPALFALAIVAGLGTALVEASWYHLVNHLPFADVLDANLSFDDDLRPAWWVFIAGFAIAALRVGRLAWARWGRVGLQGRSALSSRPDTASSRRLPRSGRPQRVTGP